MQTYMELLKDGKMGKKTKRRNSHRLKQTSTDTW